MALSILPDAIQALLGPDSLTHIIAEFWKITPSGATECHPVFLLNNLSNRPTSIGARFLVKGMLSDNTYVPHLVQGDTLHAVQLLLDDSGVDDSNLALHARQAVKAGIF
jgi:hypothetical protein